ncbi:MAG: hypothetical protein EBR67_10315 [Proteobacteria bacterium]|nr:hypothetical protein [Pseudomonadota bacterium]
MSNVNYNIANSVFPDFGIKRVDIEPPKQPQPPSKTEEITTKVLQDQADAWERRKAMSEMVGTDPSTGLPK